MTLDSASRVCLLGENGEGKTTLVKVLLGQLEPTSGWRPSTTARASRWSTSTTPISCRTTRRRWRSRWRSSRATAARRTSARCARTSASVGVSAAQQGTPSGALSGGQRSRVALAATSFAKPHLLVLDEPTNNLDLEAVAPLADAVDAFEGGFW